MPEKYQEEIEEILRRVEESVPSDSARGADRSYRDSSSLFRPTQRPPRPSPRYRARRWPTITTGRILVAGLAALLLGLLVPWVKFLIWVGLGLLVVGYLFFFIGPRSSSYEKRWRGQAVEQSTSPWDQVKRWFRG